MIDFFSALFCFRYFYYSHLPCYFCLLILALLQINTFASGVRGFPLFFIEPAELDTKSEVKPRYHPLFKIHKKYVKLAKRRIFNSRSFRLTYNLVNLFFIQQQARFKLCIQNLKHFNLCFRAAECRGRVRRKYHEGIFGYPIRDEVTLSLMT